MPPISQRALLLSMMLAGTGGMINAMRTGTCG